MPKNRLAKIPSAETAHLLFANAQISSPKKKSSFSDCCLGKINYTYNKYAYVE